MIKREGLFMLVFDPIKINSVLDIFEVIIECLLGLSDICW